jgi:hypothetical protein
MTIEYEPAPKPAPLWALPLVIALIAGALLWFVWTFSDPTTGGFGGSAQPPTPKPTRLVDGSALPELPEPLERRFGEDVVLAARIDELPPDVHQRCRDAYDDEDSHALSRLEELIDSSEVHGSHLGPDALTSLSMAVAEAPPGYPNEVAVACVARPDGDRWESPRSPYLDFALDGRRVATLDDPDLRTRLVQIPVGTRWAVQPRGGWWLAYDVRDTSWTMMTLPSAISDRDPLRVVFVDDTGEVVAERPVGPTRTAALGDHSADFELVAGDVAEVLSRLEDGPFRTCEPDSTVVCVWLAFNERQEILAYGAFGPHPLDTPPMGYVGYCPEADLMQGSVTSAQFRTDGTWAGGPSDRGLDRYTVRFEAGKVVVDLSEHVIGDPADGDAVDAEVECVFATKARGEPPEDDDDKDDKRKKDDEEDEE